MGPDHYYNLIQNEHMNKPVQIRTHDGAVHRGVVRQVDRTHVYLEPLDGADGGPMMDGPGVYWYGWGFGWPIALASIAWIAALPFLFW
ncbi:hypothetical protein PU629_11705 [Pullulanibacillus sp. KACC 23026]|uniref:hypothetical protein n=1 Tax=Pullulanibacillus sp. KACC 23026 TaxID=3028315 RepID=UPI0023B02D6A|nr:hypothetical protein [Pullulanibacillus sp. KACC 23026]WEG10847.1 hypothetical protein PU629_11705 [Pullulanibacillus sp. KACC 23026]